jgi:hypothetical protein
VQEEEYGCVGPVGNGFPVEDPDIVDLHVAVDRASHDSKHL